MTIRGARGLKKGDEIMLFSSGEGTGKSKLKMLDEDVEAAEKKERGKAEKLFLELKAKKVDADFEKWLKKLKEKSESNKKLRTRKPFR